MSTLRGWLLRLRRTLRPGSFEAEMAEEMRQHLEMDTAARLASGENAITARRSAAIEFGSADVFKEQIRDRRTIAWFEDFLRNLRFSARTLRRNLGFTTATVLTLALGACFVTTLFTVINGVAFRGLPSDPRNEVVSIAVHSEQLDHFEAQTSSEDLAVVRATFFNLSGNGTASRQPGAAVSPHLFDLLRVQPVLGRSFVGADGTAGAAQVALISDTLWRQDHAASSEVIGREVRIDGTPHTIIGVLPPGFGFPRSEHVWVPLPQDTPAAGGLVVGRLRSGISARHAAEEFTLMAARLSPDGIEPPAALAAVEVVPFAQRGVKDAVRALLTAILGATFLVLLLACANVANLILARACERTRELAVRAAVGATRRHLVAQLLTESFVLSMLGSALGLLGAYGATHWISNYTSAEKDLTGGLPYWVNFDMDGRVIAFVVGVTALVTLLTGLAPALRASRVDVSERLKDGASGSLRLSRLTRTLVNVQIALAVGLVVAAGLFLTLLIEFNQKTLPYDPTAVLTARLSASGTTYATPAQRLAVVEAVLTDLASTPSVTAAAAMGAESFRASERRIEFEGETYARSADIPRVRTDAVSTQFFTTLGLQRRSGRFFQPTEQAGTPAVAVVNIAFAARFGGESAILGRRFRLAPAAGATPAPWITIVGVSTDAGSMKAGRETDGPLFYRPLAQEPATAVTLLVRTQGSASALASILRRVVADQDADLPLNQLYPVQHIIEMERIGINLPGMLFVLCGLGALALASVGVYGVVALSVKTRTRELGVRLALGATRRDIIRLILGGGMREISVGLIVGVVLALGVSAVLASLFTEFGRSSFHFVIYAAVVALIAIVAGAALMIPALRAARVDPIIALRAD